MRDPSIGTLLPLEKGSDLVWAGSNIIREFLHDLPTLAGRAWQYRTWSDGESIAELESETIHRAFLHFEYLHVAVSYWVTACMKARPRTGLRLIVYGIKNSGVYLGKQFQGCSVI